MRPSSKPRPACVFGTVDLRGSITPEHEVERINDFLRLHDVSSDIRVLFSAITGGKRQMVETARYGISPQHATTVQCVMPEKLLSHDPVILGGFEDPFLAPAVALYEDEFLVPLEHGLYETLPDVTFRDALVAVLRLKND